MKPTTAAERQLIFLIKNRMLRDQDVTTSAGEQTTVYLDIPHVLGDKQALSVATEVLIHHLRRNKIYGVTAVVGPMTGSIPLVMGLAQADFSDADLKWAILRDKQKTHGLGRWFVGAEIGPGDKVVIVDDVADSGNSLVEAYEKMIEAGAEVLAIVPLVDRSDKTAKLITAHGSLFHKLFPNLRTTPYLPVFTYNDLGIEAL